MYAIRSYYVQDDDCERINRLAEKTWSRYFDDTLGLSQQDTMNLKGTPKQQLPLKEYLLSDKPRHVIPRTHHEKPHPDLGIKMHIPVV